MKTNIASLGCSAAIAVAAVGWLALPANAANATQQACSQQYQAAKAAGTLNGQKWNDFYSSCATSMKPAPTPSAGAQAAAPVTPTKTAKTASSSAPSTPVAAIAPAGHQTTQQICSTQYQAAKSAGSLNGQTWPQFLSSCSANIKGYNEAPATAPPAPVAVNQKAAPVATTDANGKPLSAGEIAFRQRIHECSQEWQSQKSAGTLPSGQKWPQFWSSCNAQLKAQG